SRVAESLSVAMQTSKRKIAGLVGLISAAALMIGVTNLRSGASLTHPTSNTNPPNAMPQYLKATEPAIFSGTAATHLTDAERSRLLNESMTNDLAAQLWFRHAMVGNASGWGLKMSQEIRVLESLRAGRTDDAIRALEQNLDIDILLLGDLLKVSDDTKLFKT